LDERGVDRNTSFFHNFATARKKRNFVKKLKDENGDWIEGWDNLSGHINSYFSNLFNSEVEDPNEEVINKVNPCVTEAMNEILCAPYTREEVKKPCLILGT
jgi:hypothetical protein